MHYQHHIWLAVGSVDQLSAPLCHCRCPGRAFAEMEIALFAATVLLRFDLQLSPQPPAQQGAAAEPWWQRLLFPSAALQVSPLQT
jgi:Cytochrome P450